MNIIPITRKLQEKYFYCGQVCMQMLGATGTQDDLWQKSRPYMKEANKWYIVDLKTIRVESVCFFDELILSSYTLGLKLELWS